MSLVLVEVVRNLNIVAENSSVGQEFKNNTLKNSISYGISRNQIYFSKFLVEIVIGTINLVLISASYIISAYIMLEDSGILHFNYLIRAIVACIPLFLV